MYIFRHGNRIKFYENQSKMMKIEKNHYSAHTSGEKLIQHTTLDFIGLYMERCSFSRAIL